MSASCSACCTLVLPVKILFPLPLCLFLALFVVIMGPGVITVFNLFYHRHP